MSAADGSKAAKLLAAHLDQRRRLGEPGIVADPLSARELIRLAGVGRTGAAARTGGAARPSGPGARPAPPGGSAPRRGAAASGRAAGSREVAAPDFDDYDSLRDAALGCVQCGLARTRKQVVFADGNPRARLMVVGEAPGAREDAVGLPFVGQAGRLLDLMLASVGLSRKESVYICNVVKCRPPGNRDPAAAEIEACAPYLAGQIEHVQPRALLGVGRFAGNWLAGESAPLHSLRAQVRSYRGVPLVITYHPAALLRNASLSRKAWDDLQLLCRVMNDERA